MNATRTGPTDHLRHHVRFYVAAVLGCLVWVTTSGLGPSARLLIAGDVFFLAYLGAALALVARSSHAEFRSLAGRSDEGLAVIGLITVAAVALSLGSIFALLNQPEAGAARFVLSIASVPLGWLMLHTVWAFHYADVYYGENGDHPEGGLRFPGGEEPQAWDFLYYAFVVGMTAQVSDVSVDSRRMRRLTLAHAVVSFFFNTVIVAVAVNVAVVLAP